MIALVLALVIASPRPVLCAETCTVIGNYSRCYVTPRRACLKREFLCVDSPTLDCVPLAVSLGAWSPVWNEAPHTTVTYEDWPALTPPAAPYALP